MLAHAAAHLLAQRLDLVAARLAVIDEEIAVELRDLRIPQAQAAAAGGVDQLPGFAAPAGS